MKKIAFLDTVHDVLQIGLEKLGWQCDDLSQMPQSKVESIIHSYQGIVIRSRFPMNEAFLKHATQLEFIARSGAGMENIEMRWPNMR
jgi:D-3-phosphoglycerate dehydrogenase